MESEIESLLAILAKLLRSGGNHYANQIAEAIASGNSQIEQFLVSNELWGGAGSIADQALLENKPLRKELEILLIKLGKLQIAKDKANVRTEMWISAFEKWHIKENTSK